MLNMPWALAQGEKTLFTDNSNNTRLYFKHILKITSYSPVCDKIKLIKLKPVDENK